MLRGAWDREVRRDAVVTSERGHQLGVTLDPRRTSSASMTQSGLAAFDHHNGLVTVPLPKDDGSVQVVSVIYNAAAPTEIVLELQIPHGARSELQPDGSLFIVNEVGAFLGGVPPPWAVDAQGRDVNTQFTLSGNTLTQIVDHRVRDVTYPVIADPWLGADLFSYTGYNRNGTFRSDLVISAKLSGWGWYWYTTGSGQFILRGAGWDELKAKRPRVTEKATLRQQYDCHVTFGYAVWLAGLHWDLEKARANKSDWLNTALTHRCNW